MNRFLLFLLLCFPLAAGAQTLPDKLPVLEDSLKHIGKRMFKGTDAQKELAVEKFDTYMKAALSKAESWTYPFDSLNFMARLSPDDKSFRLYNWHFPKDDGTFQYYGYIQRYNEKTKETSLLALEDHSDDIRNPEYTNLPADKWYGALYYKLVQNSIKDKTYYTLMGWDGNNKVSWKKVIDVLSFDHNGTPTFGAPIFEMGKRTKNRIIFEFKAEMVMVLRFDEKLGMIVFDKLVPEVEGMSNPPPQFMVNSFEYLGLKFKKGKWVLQKADPVNGKTRSDKLYKDPTDNGPGAVHEPAPGQEKHGFFYRLFHLRKKDPPVSI